MMTLGNRDSDLPSQESDEYWEFLVGYWIFACFILRRPGPSALQPSECLLGNAGLRTRKARRTATRLQKPFFFRFRFPPLSTQNLPPPSLPSPLYPISYILYPIPSLLSISMPQLVNHPVLNAKSRLIMHPPGTHVKSASVKSAS